MSQTTINTRIKNKRDTSANWTSKNPVLLKGEIIIVDTNEGEVRFKIGDGIKSYTQLPFSDETIKSLITAAGGTTSQISVSSNGEYPLLASSATKDTVNNSITSNVSFDSDVTLNPSTGILSVNQIKLANEPTVDSNAATKKYVDDAIKNGGNADSKTQVVLKTWTAADI